MFDDMMGVVFFVIAIVVFLGAVVFGIVNGVDQNGFSCPPGSTTVWETDKPEIEGCVFPDGRFMDDPDD